MAAYGMHLGTAFQLTDDMLDYSGDYQETGKNLGDDLAEGKATMPLIHALRHSPADVKQRLREIIEQGDASAFPEVLAAIRACGGIEYSRQLAGMYAKRAMAAITEAKANLIGQ